MDSANLQSATSSLPPLVSGMAQPTHSAFPDCAPASHGSTPSAGVPLVFIDHRGERFLFPSEECQSYDIFRRLLEEIYASADEKLLDIIKEGRFDLLDSRGNIILKSLWNIIVKSYLPLESGAVTRWYEVKIRLWKNGDAGEQQDQDETSGTGYSAGTGIQDEMRHGERSPSPGRAYRSRSSDEAQAPRISSPTEDDVSGKSETSSSEEDLISSDEEIYTRPLPKSGPKAPPPPPIPRQDELPMSDDNEPLSFLIDTSKPGTESSPTKYGSTEDLIREHLGDTAALSLGGRMILEGPVDILSASQVEVDNRWKLQLRTLQGPQNSLIAPHVTVRWYHLHGAHLDFVRFRDTCVSIASTLSARMRVLVAETLDKVKNERLQPFSEGLFIDPGVVVRGDDKDGKDAESVIFSCVPYFDIRAPSKAAPAKDTSFPRRTLMQMRYPNLPVRDRDMEQTIRKFKAGPQKQKDEILHVPTLWLMNIGSGLFITCAHSPLSHEFNSPIEVFHKNLDLVNLPYPVLGGEAKDNLRRIRMKDWYGRPLLYTIAECQTYYHLEQKLRELKWGTVRAQTDNPVELVYIEGENVRKLYPYHWPALIGDRNRIFIDVCPKELTTISDPQEDDHGYGADAATKEGHGRRDHVLPFLQWPTGNTRDDANDTATIIDEKSPNFIRADLSDSKRSTYRLAKVAKGLISEAEELYSEDDDPSRRSFKELAEEHSDSVQKKLESVVQNSNQFRTNTAKRSRHSIIVEGQNKSLVKESQSLVGILHETLKMFIDDVNEDVALRKVWSAMMGLANSMETILDEGRCTTEPSDYNDPSWISPITSTRVWTVRYPPGSDEQDEFTNSAEKAIAARIRRCRKCRSNHIYTDPQAALKHVRKHAQALAESRSPHVDMQQSAALEDCIRNYDQALVEERNAATLKMMQQASRDAKSLLTLLQELQDGARAEDGEITDAFVFPDELVKTLRKTLLFYLKIERDVRSTSAISEHAIDRPAFMRVVSCMYHLERYCGNIKVSIQAARKDLCSMVSSHGVYRVTERVSLSAPYICAWLMRRLLVGAVDQKLTVVDLYREYLKTIQLQVNHQPNKRLLRSISLLREDLTALAKVNAAQIKLMGSYGRVLDDKSYLYLDYNRKGVWGYERQILESCLDHLHGMRDDMISLIGRCPRLAETAKAFAEINEEDHGKAILVFTVVTVIFLPLSFVTSYFGMNTTDIRDMGSSQSLYWIVAVPLTVVVIGTCLFLASNGDEIRRHALAMFRRLAGKEGENVDADGISLYRRKQILDLLRKRGSGAAEIQYGTPAEEADYVPAQLEVQDPVQTSRETFARQTTWKTSINTEPELIYAPPISSEPYTSYAKHSKELSNPFTAKATGYDPEIPVITKIPRTGLEPESLAAMNIPWEYDDQDRDYYLIPRNLSEHKTDELFAHTRQLRENAKRRGKTRKRDDRRTERRARFEEDYDNGQEYEWVDRDEYVGERRSSMRHTERAADPGVNTEWLRDLGRPRAVREEFRVWRSGDVDVRRRSEYRGKPYEEDDGW